MTIYKKQLYSIKDLENFTQIKAHTIRIWEQRYQLLEPERTDSNIRSYSENDLKKILNIKLLYSTGLKISKIAALSENEIIEKAKSIITESGNKKANKWVNEVLVLILEFNVSALRKLFKRELRKIPLEELYLSKVLPLMITLGELWQVNSVGITHEHFFSNLLREFFISQINTLPANKESKGDAVLFLHDEEEHEFSILLYYYLLKKEGYECYYFGQKTPVLEIIEIQKRVKPELIVTTFTSYLEQKEFDKILEPLKLMSKKSKVLVSGNQLNRLEFKLPSTILNVKTVEQLYSHIGKKIA